MKKLATLALALFAGSTFAQQQTLTISGFPNLTDAIKPIIEQYMEENPEVKVELQVREFADHHNNLVTTLAAGTGATDVVAIEVGYIAK